MYLTLQKGLSFKTTSNGKRGPNHDNKKDVNDKDNNNDDNNDNDNDEKNLTPSYKIVILVYL